MSAIGRMLATLQRPSRSSSEPVPRRAQASADFDGDGFSDLVIGVPYEDIGAVNDDAVNVIHGRREGSHPDQLWRQDSRERLCELVAGAALAAPARSAHAGCVCHFCSGRF